MNKERKTQLRRRLANAIVSKLEQVLAARQITGNVSLAKLVKSKKSTVGPCWISAIDIALPEDVFSRSDDDTDSNSAFDIIVFEYNQRSDNSITLSEYRRDLYCLFMKAIGDGLAEELQKEPGCSQVRWQFPKEGSHRWNLRALGIPEQRTFYVDCLPKAFIQKEKGELLRGVSVTYTFGAKSDQRQRKTGAPKGTPKSTGKKAR